MVEILDSFQVTAELIARYPIRPEWMAVGIWFMLDPEKTKQREPPGIGQVATITKLNGEKVAAEIIGSETRHSVMALRFKGIETTILPRFSLVEW